MQCLVSKPLNQELFLCHVEGSRPSWRAKLGLSKLNLRIHIDLSNSVFLSITGGPLSPQ